MIQHPAINKGRHFHLLLVKVFLFSHGPLGLPLPLSETFPEAAAAYLLLSFSEKFRFLPNFFRIDPNAREGQHLFNKSETLSMGECIAEKSKGFFEPFHQAIYRKVLFHPFFGQLEDRDHICPVSASISLSASSRAVGNIGSQLMLANQWGIACMFSLVSTTHAS